MTEESIRAGESVIEGELHYVDASGEEHTESLRSVVLRFKAIIEALEACHYGQLESKEPG